MLGSLAWTGAGHATDTAIILGLAGFSPETIEPLQIDNIVERARETRRLQIAGRGIAFDADADIVFDREGATPVHPNTLRFVALGETGEEVLSQRWCSIGGGFIALEERVGTPAIGTADLSPFPFSTAEELLAHCEHNGLTIAEIVRANERSRSNQDQLDA